MDNPFPGDPLNSVEGKMPRGTWQEGAGVDNVESKDRAAEMWHQDTGEDVWGSGEAALGPP